MGDSEFVSYGGIQSGGGSRCSHRTHAEMSTIQASMRGGQGPEALRGSTSVSTGQGGLHGSGRPEGVGRMAFLVRGTAHKGMKVGVAECQEPA